MKKEEKKIKVIYIYKLHIFYTGTSITQSDDYATSILPSFCYRFWCYNIKVTKKNFYWSLKHTQGF